MLEVQQGQFLASPSSVHYTTFDKIRKANSACVFPTFLSILSRGLELDFLFYLSFEVHREAHLIHELLRTCPFKPVSFLET